MYKHLYFQDVLDITTESGYIVRVMSGIDIVSGKSTWELTTIDPETGSSYSNILCLTDRKY